MKTRAFFLLWLFLIVSFCNIAKAQYYNQALNMEMMMLNAQLMRNAQNSWQNFQNQQAQDFRTMQIRQQQLQNQFAEEARRNVNNQVNYNSTNTNSTYNSDDCGNRVDYKKRKQESLNRTVGEKCTHCKGSGKCPACNGTKVAHSYGNSYKCTVCNVNGACPVCNGTGKTPWNR